MHILFLTCLVGGVVAIAVFGSLAVAGAGHGHVGHGHHGHLQHGHVHHAGGNLHDWTGSIVWWTLSWLSPLTLAAALLWFGGAGLLAESTPVAIPAALLAAIAAAWLVRTLMSSLANSSTAPLALTAEGAIGTVNATIRAGGTGEVIYTLEGLHRSMPARSVDGTSIPRGASVVITGSAGGIAWVEPLDPLGF